MVVATVFAARRADRLGSDIQYWSEVMQETPAVPTTAILIITIAKRLALVGRSGLRSSGQMVGSKGLLESLKVDTSQVVKKKSTKDSKHCIKETQ